MKGIILAAGRGSRMGNLTDSAPKGMVELFGKPLIARQIDTLRLAGIKQIGLVTGYRAEVLQQFNLPTFDNPDWSRTNMLHSLRQASDWLGGDVCIVSYSDIFYTPEVVGALLASDADIAIAYDPDWLELWSQRFADPLADAETFRREADTGRLLEIGARATCTEQIEGQYMGLLRFSPRGWRSVEALLDGIPQQERERLDMTTLLSKLITANIAIATVANHHPWGEIDSEDDLNLYQSLGPEATLRRAHEY
jgi:choline kinase